MYEWRDEADTEAETEPTEIKKLTETIITLLEAQRSLKPVNETK
jgi:hypothetical protein